MAHTAALPRPRTVPAPTTRARSGASARGATVSRPADRAATAATAVTAAHVDREAEARWLADPDVQLMLRVRDGDHLAFRELFTKYREGMLGFTHRFVAN